MNREGFADLLRKAKRGDRAALDEALQRVSGQLRSAASGQLRPEYRAALGTSDVLQSTYLDVIRYIGDFRGDDQGSFESWLRTVLDNNIRQRIRSLQRDKRRRPEGERIDPNDVTSAIKSPSLQAIDVEHLSVVGRALEGLSDDYRAVLELRLLEGMDYPAVAAALGRSEGATRMLYLRARAALAMAIDRAADE